jgi:hypothetical protein
MRKPRDKEDVMVVYFRAVDVSFTFTSGRSIFDLFYPYIVEVEMEDTIPFATYFVERLKQCGVKYVQGVPGDYNLELVSHFQGKEVDD